MKIHHLNCATLCPFGGSLVSGEGGLFSAARLVCHCLLVETTTGLVLIDTGFGLDDIAHTTHRLGVVAPFFMRAKLDPKETAARQVERLGYRRSDVRHVIVTHLDTDHAGGLADFPHATVHVYQPELEAARKRATANERQRYREVHWAHNPVWSVYKTGGDRWFGFDCVRQLKGLPPEILIVPLPGHTRGHSAVAVKTERDWLVHCGDAYFFHGEMHPEKPWCSTGLRVFQNALAVDNEQRIANAARLRELARERTDEVRLFCAHDTKEFERLAHAGRHCHP